MVALGDRVYHTNTCVGCHGSNAEGTPLGSDLTKANGCGATAAGCDRPDDHQGVAKPKERTGVMPPMGRTALSIRSLGTRRVYRALTSEPSMELEQREDDAGSGRRAAV